VKRFGAIILACAFSAAVFAADVPSSPPTTTSGSAEKAVSNSMPAQPRASAQAAAGESDLPTEAAVPLFYIGPLPISNSVVCSWIVAAIILVIVRVSTWKNIKMVPSGMQNALEALVEGWENLMSDILDPRVKRWVFPYAVTYFIFIIMSNYVDLIPGVDTIGFGTPARHSWLPFALTDVGHPFFRPPTTDANLTVAMTVIFLVMGLYWALRYNGFGGFVKHVFGVKMKTPKWVFPLALLLFLFIGLMEVISILFARPVALAMRLFGNIFAGQTMIDMGMHYPSWLGGIGITLLVYCYETFVCAVQALVFALLVVAFTATMCPSAEEQGGH
jgi:F-type H+-transporting ATPase subunit a